MYNNCRHSTDTFFGRTYTSTWTRKWTIIYRKSMSTSRIWTFFRSINDNGFKNSSYARGKNKIYVILLSFLFIFKKRSVSILSKHSLFAENKEENLRLITPKDFDFIIRLLVISYLDSSWKSKLWQHMSWKQLFLSFPSLFFVFFLLRLLLLLLLFVVDDG